MEILQSKHLNAPSALPALGFASTSDLVSGKPSQQHAWVAQSAAKEAALFGLKISQVGFNVLVLGEHGSGRTSLMHSAMQEVAASQATQPLHDWVAVYAFEQSDQPTLIKLPVGQGVLFRTEMDTFVRDLMQVLPQFFSAPNNQLMPDKVQDWLDAALPQLTCAAQPAFKQYLAYLKRDVLTYLKTWQAAAPEADNSLDGLMNESFFARFRVNLLVDHKLTQTQALQQPVVYDNDPSYQSLFGWLEGAADISQPDFLRLRAGNLHKADGGMLLIHLRDLLNDEQNGNQILEKLYRFLRNGTLQFEDLAGGAQSSGAVLANTVMPVQVKLVLIAMREDFYNMLEQHPDFFDYFPIKVEFADSINAEANNYEAIAGFVAQKCLQHQCPHFSNEAVASLIGALQRLEEDQTRISTNFAFLERLMLESAAYAGGNPLVQTEHVQQAIQARNKRRQYFETQIRDSITDNELLIQVDGAVVGQINGLTHIELGDASFGSPIRITARCYPGQKGLINIDREVNMSGPNHDKGIFILQNWLSASFSNLAPLSLNASLVFEQEYNGVEGDSASCAELFALLSALANLPLQQGIAITGALNQFGEVMPIGGINEKIDGYFRVCQALGLNGQQGVIIPKRNQRHLLLDDEVVQAVRAGLFKVITIDHVLEGIAYLTGVEAGTQDAQGNYAANTVMGHAQRVLADYRKTLESNQPSHKRNSRD